MSIRLVQRGFTLVEIMISIVIGLFLTAGMIQMFVANKQSYRFNEGLAHMQENGRYALEIMASDLRLADFWGCAGSDKITDNLNDIAGSPVFGDPPEGLSGSEGAAATDPDSIEITGVTGQGVRLDAPMAGSTGDVVTESTTAFAVDGIVLVANCESGDIFQATAVAQGAGTTALSHAQAAPPADPDDPPNNVTNTVSEVYDEAASVYAARTVEYDIADSNGQPSLRRSENGGAFQPIAEGVANMQITYGRDLDLNDDATNTGVHTANRYEPAPGAPPAGWFDNVVSVRVSLLLRSTEDNLTDAPQTILYNGANFNAPDRHLYQVMNATISIRNRLQ